MTILIKNAQRYSLRQLRADNPGVSFPREPSADLLAQYDVHEVERVAPPVYDPMTQRLVESFAGNVHTWIIESKAPEEILAGLPWQNALEARKAMVEWTNSLTSQIEALYPSAVQKRWVEEEAAARSVKAGTATPRQLAIVTDEGAVKGRTPEEHADAIIDNADRFRAIADQVNKLFLAVDARLQAAASPLEYPAIFDWAKAQAAPLAQAYGLEVGE